MTNGTRVRSVESRICELFRMHHVLVAPEDKSGVTKARDANLRDEDEEWFVFNIHPSVALFMLRYPIDDPRNKMNIRRRLENNME